MPSSGFLNGDESDDVEVDGSRAEEYSGLARGMDKLGGDSVCKDCCDEAEAAMSGLSKPWDHIQYISEADYMKSHNGLDLAGYHGEGWYFWDETDAGCHGPYESRDEAEAKILQYVAWLHKEGSDES